MANSNATAGERSRSPCGVLRSAGGDFALWMGACAVRDPREGGEFTLVGVAITPTGQLGDLAGRTLCSDSRAGAVDVEAGVLVVVHQPSSKVDRLLLGQVACGDFGFECAP
jgi:hypothetical protein